MPYRPLPPMDAEEHRGIVLSLLFKIIGSIIFAAIGVYLTVKYSLRLDVPSSALLGFFFFFTIGSKFFPESTKFIGRRARNYRRAKRGRPPLDVDDEPTAEIITDFQRKG